MSSVLSRSERGMFVSLRAP